MFNTKSKKPLPPDRKITEFMTGVNAKKNIAKVVVEKVRKRPVPVTAECVQFKVNGVAVLLPPNFQAYASQKQIVVKLMQAFNAKKHALIESPTGSGKTMGLLAASCAWLSHHNQLRKAAREKCPKHGCPSTSEEPSPKIMRRSTSKSEDSIKVACSCSEFKKVRIYYGTRTHRQITQVVKEFASLPYGGFNVVGGLSHTIFASREQSCLNTEVRQAENVTAACKERNVIDGMGCKYLGNLKVYEREPGKLRKKIENLDSGIWDMEDLEDALKEPEICPYYATNRVLSIDADIIFTPFNYLIDPIIRASSSVILKDSIVILDEAHNVEDISRDAVSYYFEESELHESLQNIQSKVPGVEKHLSGLMKLKGGRQDDVKDLEKFAESLQRLKTLVENLVRLMKKLSTEAGDAMSKTWSHTEFLKLLKDGVYFEKEDVGFNQLRNDFVFVTSRRSKQKQGLPDVLQKFKLSSLTINAIEKFLFFMSYYHHEENSRFYKCNVAYNPVIPAPAARGRKVQVGSKETIMKGFNCIMNFWCMAPSVAFNQAFQECHSLILASGTLCPMESLKSELGFKFDIDMEGDQSISKDRIFASILSKSANSYPFVCTYKNMQESNFYVELLQSIHSVCEIVPKGILVFVSSYRVINEIQTYMQVGEIEEKIQKHKEIFWEPSKSSELKQTLQDYSAAIRKHGSDTGSLNGAIMFAVFRGKVSEGIDFSDDMARCVICVGIPFPSTSDELVLQKKAYNDANHHNSNILSGSEWYSTQAYRALNQALGRCLRHRNDWGAILLVDARFIEKANPNCSDGQKISRWVRQSLVKFETHESLIKALSNFVQKRMEI